MKSISLRSAVLGSMALAMAACGQKNPDACCTTAADCLMYGFDDITPCAGDRVCNASGTCVVPACHTTADCHDAALVCDTYGQCVPEGDQTQHTLTVQIAGTGAGAVTSSPAGITCSSGSCSGTFDAGTQVQLDASATTGVFLGWTTSCSGKTSCTVTLDKDVNVGALFGDPGELLWAKQFGVAGADMAAGVASTNDGNLVVAGYFAGAVPFGSVTLSSPNTTTPNIFIAKLDGFTGSVIWARSYQADSADSIALDPDDNIYVSGTFTGVLDFGAGTTLSSAGLIDTFVAKFSPVGDPMWTFQIGGPNNDPVVSLSVRDDHVAVAGMHSGVKIGSQTFGTHGGIDIFVVDLHRDGTLRWSKSLGGFGDDVAGGAVLDSHDNLFVTGGFTQMVNFGTGTITATGDTDMFLTAYQATQGDPVLVEHFGANGGTAIGNRIAIDAADELFVAGQFFGTIDFGQGHTGSSTATTAAFTSKYSSSGMNAWFQPTTTSGSVIPGPAVATPSNDFLYAGGFCGSVTYGSAVYTSTVTCQIQPRRYDGFLALLGNATGDAVDSTWIGGLQAKSIHGIEESADFRRHLAGRFAGTLNIGPSQLTTAGADDAFVVALAPQ